MKHNALFEECLANVSPDVKADVERNIDHAIANNITYKDYDNQQ